MTGSLQDRFVKFHVNTTVDTKALDHSEMEGKYPIQHFPKRCCQTDLLVPLFLIWSREWSALLGLRSNRWPMLSSSLTSNFPQLRTLKREKVQMAVNGGVYQHHRAAGPSIARISYARP